MKAKKRTRLISLLLALVMAFSAVTATITAQAAYKPVYTDKVTEEDVTLMINDINTILKDQAFTGNTIQDIYKKLPALSSIVMLTGGSDSSRTAKFYKTLDPERFADLPDGEIVDDVVDENGNITTPGTFTTFFESHPIVCETAADFQNELNKIVEMVVCPNVLSTIVFAFLMSGKPEDIENAKELGQGLDEICEAIGVEQPVPANTAIGFETFQGDEKATETYIKNIIAAVFPDTANGALDIVRDILKDDNGAKLYSGVTKVLTNLSNVLTTLSGALAGLGVDLSAVADTINEIKTTFEALPTLGDGDSKRIDLEGSITYLLSDLTSGLVTVSFSDDPSTGKAMLNFRSMKLDRVTQSETNADLVKIVYDYLYENLIANESNAKLLNMAISTGLIENALGFTIPEDTKATILAAFDMSNEDLLNEAVVLVADAAGREIPEEPTTEPTTKPSTEPTTKPSKEPTTNGSKDQGTNDKTTVKADNDNATTKKAVTNNPNIPNTGSVDYSNYTAICVLVCITAAVALVMILVSEKKKASQN